MDRKDRLKKILKDPYLFSLTGAGLKLRDYQRQPAHAIVNSIINHLGHSIVIMFPRQSGKNELQAQIEAYLMLILSSKRSDIVKISPTWKPQTINAMMRLEHVLKSNRLTRRRWKKEAGYIFRIDNCRVYFLSGQKQANIVGATASTMLSIDEAQEISIEKYDKEIAPMAASTNATRVFWGTAWTTSTLLARELRNAQADQAQDGIQRVFRIDADTVADEVPAYGMYVANQVARRGREHPLIKTQFYSEELSGEGGLFPPERIARMKGTHQVQHGPEANKQYCFLLDFAGEDTGAEGSSFTNRDLNALTIVQVDTSTRSDPRFRAPSYRAVHRQEWKGTNHNLIVSAINQLIDKWHPRYVVTDATGLGAPLTSFLERTHKGRIIPFVFTSKSKSSLGWDFIALLDSCRWQEFSAGDPIQIKFQKEFYRQMNFTAFDLVNQQLRWGVPDGTRDQETGDLIHDDWIMSAAMCTLLDDQPFASSEVSENHIIRAKDPLDEMDGAF